MKTGIIFILLSLLSSCDLIRLLNTSEQKNESTEEINLFLKKKKYNYDFSFENIDSTSSLLTGSNYRLNDSNKKYSFIQLRIYDSTGYLYTGFSQCMGSFNEKKIIDRLPPLKNNYPFLNTKLRLEDELDLINIDSGSKLKLIEEFAEFDYVFVVYWTIWTKYFSKHVLKQVSKIKGKEPDKVLVLFVNTAKEKSISTTNE